MLLHHGADERGHLLLARPGPVEVLEHLLLALGGGGAEGQPAATGRHQHQTGDPLPLGLGHRDGGGTAEAVAEQVELTDTELLEGLEEGIDGDLGDGPIVEVCFGGPVAVAEAGLVGQQDPETLRQGGQVLVVVADPGGTGPAAVQHHQHGSVPGDLGDGDLAEGGLHAVLPEFDICDRGDT